MKTTVRLRDCESLEEREFFYQIEDAKPEDYLSTTEAVAFIWSEGNYGCDCNRSGYFDKDDPCGEGRYVVIFIKNESGETIYTETAK